MGVVSFIDSKRSELRGSLKRGNRVLTFGHIKCPSNL